MIQTRLVAPHLYPVDCIVEPRKPEKPDKPDKPTIRGRYAPLVISHLKTADTCTVASLSEALEAGKKAIEKALRVMARRGILDYSIGYRQQKIYFFRTE